MKVSEAMRRLGGIAAGRELKRLTSRRKVERALRRGEIVQVAHGRYALPTADEGRRAAHRLSAVVTGRSAAAAHGLAMKAQPERPEVAVPRNRKVSKERREGVDLSWRDIPPDDVRNGVLRVGPTVIDCARRLPFDEALAIADSALRAGLLSRTTLIRLAEAVPSTGRTEALRVAHAASGKPSNPFESVLRAIGLDVPGLDLQPHVLITDGGLRVAPDLVDVERRIVVEAESFEFHGKRKALKRDCERYTALVLAGWRVIRFAWEHVMFEPEYVRACLEQLAALPVPPVHGGRAPLRRTDTPAA